MRNCRSWSRSSPSARTKRLARRIAACFVLAWRMSGGTVKKGGRQHSDRMEAPTQPFYERDDHERKHRHGCKNNPADRDGEQRENPLRVHDQFCGRRVEVGHFASCLGWRICASATDPTGRKTVTASSSVRPELSSGTKRLRILTILRSSSMMAFSPGVQSNAVNWERHISRRISRIVSLRACAALSSLGASALHPGPGSGIGRGGTWICLVMSCSLFSGAAAQAPPFFSKVRAQLFTGDGAAGGVLDVHAEHRTERLTGGNSFPEVSDGRVARLCKLFPCKRRDAVYVREKFFHVHRLPVGNL